MKVRKAVITAGSPTQRSLPLQTLIDRDGTPRSALEILLQEVRSAGIERVAVIVHRGDGQVYSAALGQSASFVDFIEQDAPRGFGHAVACARTFVGQEPFLLMVGDHLYVSSRDRSCASQLLEAAGEAGCSVSAVQPTHESQLNRFGAVGGQPVRGKRGWYKIERVLEKPTPTQAEQVLSCPGLRAGYYLCFFGMHVLTPKIFELLERRLSAAQQSQLVQLSDALDELAQHERYLACELEGRRYDIGARYGLFVAQLALSLAGCDRDLILRRIIETMAESLG